MTTPKASSYKFPAPTLTDSDIKNIQSYTFSNLVTTVDGVTKPASGLDVAITGKFVLYSE